MQAFQLLGRLIDSNTGTDSALTPRCTPGMAGYTRGEPGADPVFTASSHPGPNPGSAPGELQELVAMVSVSTHRARSRDRSGCNQQCTLQTNKNTCECLHTPDHTHTHTHTHTTMPAHGTCMPERTHTLVLGTCVDKIANKKTCHS